MSHLLLSLLAVLVLVVVVAKCQVEISTKRADVTRGLAVRPRLLSLHVFNAPSTASAVTATSDSSPFSSLMQGIFGMKPLGQLVANTIVSVSKLVSAPCLLFFSASTEHCFSVCTYLTMSCSSLASVPSRVDNYSYFTDDLPSFSMLSVKKSW